MTKATRRTWFVAAVVVVAAALALPKLLSLDNGRSAGPSPAAGVSAALPVEVRRLVPEPLAEQLSTTGTVLANEEVDLVSEIAGKVESIRFSEGSRVETGQLLLEIDDEELQAEVARARHRAELMERRERRQQKLREEGVISQEEYDFVASELNVLRSELRLREAQLGKTTIRAPFAGVIGLRRVSAGSFLTPQTRIATLQDLDPVKVEFSIPEMYVGEVAVGHSIEFTVKGSDRRFRGEVYAIEPSVDPATRSLVLRARCPNRDGALVPGAFASVELVVRQVAEALTVPSIAVIPELGGKKVFVVEEGRAQPRSVETGIRTGDRVQITAGLEPGDRVIVSAIQQLRAGLPVAAHESG